MRSETNDAARRFALRDSTEIDAAVECVFDLWSRYEDFPRFTESVRGTKRIDERRVLWDVDIGGRQIVWEARIVEMVPEKLIRWESTWGAANFGEVRFESLSADRTQVSVDIEYRPNGRLERLGARLKLADLYLHRDLGRFRRYVERLRPAGPDERIADDTGAATRGGGDVAPPR